MRIAHAGTAILPTLRSTLLSTWWVASVFLGGCPGAPAPADAGPDAGAILRSCAEAEGAPSGAPCDFAEVCGDFCAAGGTSCVGGQVMHHLAGCADAASPRDADEDAGPPADALSCTIDEPRGACRSDGDCSSARFERCIAPGENPGCGICMMAEQLCATDADCASDPPSVCVTTYNPCAVCAGGDGHGTQCVPSCATTGCPDGESCATDGHCTPIFCNAGYACPLGTTCADDGSGGDAHGCVRTTCTTDAQCPCGAGCVEGLCYDALGSCEPPRA